MFKSSVIALVFVSILLLSACTSTPTPLISDPEANLVVGYYPSWAASQNDFLANSPTEELTHINYAFSNVTESGECILGDPVADVGRYYSAKESVSGREDKKSAGFHGNFNQFLELKKKSPDLKILISIGGWTWSGNFSNAAKDESSRQRFASSCIDLYLKQYPGVFDGLDIDWEYPVSGGLTSGTARDKHNFTLLLQEVRRQLDELGTSRNQNYLLTIAAPIGPGTIRNMELSNVASVVDWINLMAYDFHGTWDSTTNFNAPLFKTSLDPADAGLNIDAAIQTYLSLGVPAKKLVLGVPFYGHGWAGVTDANHGLYQPASGAAPGTREPGSYTFNDIKNNYLSKSERYWNEEAYVPWLYDPASQIFISYDDGQSLKAKAGYAHDQGLAGVMIWDISQGDASLVAALYQGLEGSGPPRPTPVPTVMNPRPFEVNIHSVRGISLDGKLDDWPAEPDFLLNDASQIVYQAAPKSWAGPQDLSAKAWASWDTEGLYFAFEVVDDIHVQTAADESLWHGDHMELQFDTSLEKDYTNPGMNDDDYQIGLSIGDPVGIPPLVYAWFNGPKSAGEVKSIQMQYIFTDAGYTLEVFIPKDALNGLNLAEGSSFGMNISPSDADDPAQGQKAMLSTSKIRTYADPRTFGKVTLVK